MLSKEKIAEARARALEYFERAHIVLTDEEKANVEIADMGLGDLDTMGLQLVTYVSTERCSAKELVLFPYQTCPEHRHPPLSPTNPGKEETFRCRYGEVYVYVDGEPAETIAAKIPAGKEEYFTARHEIVLHPGEQFTLVPNPRHWFQAGPEGCIVSEFSTKNVDEEDIFTDPAIIRMPDMPE